MFAPRRHPGSSRPSRRPAALTQSNSMSVIRASSAQIIGLFALIAKTHSESILSVPRYSWECR